MSTRPPAGSPASPVITLLPPVRIDRKHPVSDLDRFAAIGLPSLVRNLAPGLVHELIVVPPPENVAAVRQRLCPAPFPVRVVNEATLCPAVAKERGWYKQQVIKLASASLVQTPWYLTLDADVVCVRPIDHAFLFPDGRALWQRERASTHTEWWRASREILQSGISLTGESVVFGVTPALMHTASTQALVARLASLSPEVNWAANLMRRQNMDWTEYSIYWTHLLDAGLADTLYSSSTSASLYNEAIWFPEQIKTLSPDKLDRIFDGQARHGFFIFQSSVPLGLEFVAGLIRPRLGLPLSLPISARLGLKRHVSRSRALAAGVVRRLRGLLGSKKGPRSS